MGLFAHNEALSNGSSISQDAIQAQQVIAKMSALGLGESNSGESGQPLYANTHEDNTNANNRAPADRENNSIPVSSSNISTSVSSH